MASEKLRCRVGCRLSYDVAEANTFIFNVAPINSERQAPESEKLSIDPDLSREEFRSALGNRYLRMHAPSGRLDLQYEAVVRIAPLWRSADTLTEVPPARLPMEVLPFINPSRYCPSDRLLNLVQREFGWTQPGFARVRAISDWVCNHLEYAPGFSDQHTAATDSLVSRRGVCRDFAHLAIALCRAMNIPARFVSVYAYGLPMVDFHACFEAYLGDGWYVFDPTGQAQMSTLVRIGTGRDAADVSFATIFGWAQMSFMEVSVAVEGVVPDIAPLADGTWSNP